jgi:hypothetical protein
MTARIGRWEPARRQRGTPIVACERCPRVSIEPSSLRRDGWQQLAIGTRRVYRCGRCSEVLA